MGFSFAVCNQGLTTILSISVPVLNVVYPIAITLIVMGLCDKWLRNNSFAYPCTVGAVGVISVLYALDDMAVPLGFVGKLCHKLPFYSFGMGWVVAGVVVLALSFVPAKLKKASRTDCAADTVA